LHLLDVSRGFYGGWGIVAGQLPVATGLALGLVRQHRSQAVLCELGDGAVNMGAWNEALNLAALWELPVVFLVVNNGYGMGTAVARSAEPELYRRACAFRMHGERVDGDDLDAVVEGSARLLREARERRRPAVLEAMTYRYAATPSPTPAWCIAPRSRLRRGWRATRSCASASGCGPTTV
jgi:pyruvate dehydrogenase E1 component alpha subunit